MPKSATEQFQIKKKRKHPLNVSAATLLHKSSKRHVHSVPLSSDLLIKENYSQFQIDDKESKINSLLQITSRAGLAAATAATAATAAVYNFADLKCATLSTANINTYKTTPTEVKKVLGTTRTKNCLRDQTQVLRHDNMPLSHGFYVKGALASKRGLQTLRMSNGSGTSTAPEYTPEEAKRPRRSNENIQLDIPSITDGKPSNNLQLSYLLGESLSRHGRLQEAFDVYALIASEQPEGFIPLEKLNILATALLEYIRILSSNSKKPADLLNSQMNPTKATITSTGSADNGSNNEQLNLSTALHTKFSSSMVNAFSWQLAGAALSTHPSKLRDLGSDFLASNVGSNLDLHAPSRELTCASGNDYIQETYDPLMCPLCRDVLRCPVTTNCGHTFCRQCCETITMCNVCHVKFPRCQKDDFVNESMAVNPNANCFISGNNGNNNNNNNYSNKVINLATLSTATTTTTSIDLNTMTANNNANNSRSQNIYTSETSYYSTSLPATNSTSTSASASLVTHLNDLQRLQIMTTPLASPTTVTTTSIACTTDTATTTMASTASTSGVAQRSNISSDNMKFMPDVLVRRLVEKWWGSDLQAKKINETATSYMHLNLLDDALKFCNASLEKSPTNFKSLLLRAEVLRKMNHYQSSLADVDNALKARYISAKGHYLRALALSDLSRYEEALYEICLAVGMDKSASLSNTELFQHDLTKILQKLLSQPPKCLKIDLSVLRAKAPYSVYSEHRMRRKNISVLGNNMQDEEAVHLYEDEDFLSANYGKECDILADEDVLACADFLNCADKRTTYTNIAQKYELELKRQSTRKHFRRKWMQKETELLPSIEEETARCSSQFRNVLERMQQEIERLKKIELSSEYFQRHLAAVSPSLIDASDFDCVLCCRTFWKPVVTPCGHTYCLVCLDRCMDYTSSCPLCMSPLVEPCLNIYQGTSSPIPLILTKRPVTKFLEAAMKRFIPESYNKRFRQEMVMEPSVPIFICTTAFPYVPCPLFVYEPRYRLMVRRAVESGDKQFGIVQPHSGKSRYYDYGCILDIRDCVLLGDGCSILSTVGCKRFKILARNEKDGYETAKVEYIHDETIPDEHLSYVTKMHDVVLSKAIQWYKSLGEDLTHEILQSYGEMPIVEPNWETIADGPAWAWWIIALLPLRPQLKVDILATTSLEKRLRAIEKTIHSMPSSCRYQRVSQDCDVAVVIHNPQHRAHHVGEDDEENEGIVDHHARVEGDVTHADVDEEEDDQQQSSMQHHIEHVSLDQQHSSHTGLQQQQQMHQQPYDDVTTVDECCQLRTDLVHSQLEVTEEALDATNHHHGRHRHRRCGHTHSLLL